MGLFGFFKKQKAEEEEQRFFHDKAEYQWESALEEYCNQQGIEEVAGETVLGVRFSWKLYHQFEPTLDKAYQNYCK